MMLTAAGLVLLLIAAFFFARSFLLTIRGKKAAGVVVRLVDDGEGMSASVVRFEAGGRPIEFRDSVYRNPPDRIGKEVVVLYRPGRPQAAKIRSLSSLYLLPAGIAIFGAALIVSGVVTAN